MELVFPVLKAFNFFLLLYMSLPDPIQALVTFIWTSTCLIYGVKWTVEEVS